MRPDFVDRNKKGNAREEEVRVRGIISPGFNRCQGSGCMLIFQRRRYSRAAAARDYIGPFTIEARPSPEFKARRTSQYIQIRNAKKGEGRSIRRRSDFLPSSLPFPSLPRFLEIKIKIKISKMESHSREGGGGGGGEMRENVCISAVDSVSKARQIDSSGSIRIGAGRIRGRVGCIVSCNVRESWSRRANWDCRNTRN